MPRLRRSASAPAERLGRQVDVFVGGRSAAELESDFAAAEDVMNDIHRRTGSYPPFEILKDFETGAVILKINPAGLSEADLDELPSEVVIEHDTTLEHDTPDSYGGIARNPGCTTGYQIRNMTTERRAIITAGHCSDTNVTAYGLSLGNAHSDVCTNTDRQAHNHPNGEPVWNGFYNFNNVWTTIHAIAGGWFEGQTFFRRGRHTRALGTISDIRNRSYNGGDCGQYTVRGFNLANTQGQNRQPGDSGGPLLLLYNGNWYIAGTHAGPGPSGTHGHAAWKSIPSGWVGCSSQNTCS